MKTTLNVLAIVFLLLGLTFTVLPLGTIAYFPIALALICAAASLFFAKGDKKMSKALLTIGVVLGLAVLIKSVAVKNEVTPATEQELQKKEESEKENLEDLENLE